MAFRVGQKVVCVNDGRYPDEPGPYVVKGEVYTIAGIITEDINVNGERAVVGMLVFHELPLAKSEDWSTGYHPSHFRPLIERKTDTGMAILRKLLDGNKIEEKV